jgi:hypothetical protein
MRSDAAADFMPHHDLAEVPVGFHVLERLADVVEGKHLVDRQLQLARFNGAQISLRTSSKISRIEAASSGYCSRSRRSR